MKDTHVYQIGEKVRSRMLWNRGSICTVVDTQNPILMNGTVLVSQCIKIQYSDDPEDTSGWLSYHEVEPI